MTCLAFALASCTDDTQTEAGDEVATESESTTESGSTTEASESESTESESSSEESTESDSTESDSTESGSTESESTDTTDTTDTTEESTSEESTSEESTSDTGLGTCQEIESAYVALVESSTSCDADAQCHVVDGHCNDGLGGCWYVVNDTLQQLDLDLLFNAFQGMACPPLVICACLPPPNLVGCVDGTCQPL